MAVPEYITAGEFTRWRAEETEFRKGIKADLGEIIGLVRNQNGRLGSAEAAIQIIQRDLEAIKSEDLSIQGTVESIQRDGCHQFQNHQEALTVLEGAGVLPNTDGAQPRTNGFKFPTLTPRQKVAAGVGGAALIFPALADLAKWIYTGLSWLQSVHAGQ